MSSSEKKCYFCKEKIGPMESYFMVREATAPKGTPFRWKVIGYACEECGEKNHCALDDYM